MALFIQKYELYVLFKIDYFFVDKLLQYFNDNVLSFSSREISKNNYIVVLFSLHFNNLFENVQSHPEFTNVSGIWDGDGTFMPD